MAETGYRHLSRAEHNFKYQNHHIINNNNINNKFPARPHSPASSSATDTTSEPDTSVSGRRRRHYHQHQHNYHRPQMHYGHGLQAQQQPPRTGTMRSTRSVPALNITPWDQHPPECPVHGHFTPIGHSGYTMHPMGPPMTLVPQHQPQTPGGPMLRRAGSMFDMREVYGHPMGHFVPYHTGMVPQDRKSMYGSVRSVKSVGHFQGIHGLQALPPMPPAHLLPPGMRTRPLVIPAGAEPLPVRDPVKPQAAIGSASGAEKKDGAPRSGTDCCKGPLPIVWFIISIVTVGVILGVILGSIFG